MALAPSATTRLNEAAPIRVMVVDDLDVDTLLDFGKQKDAA